MTLVVGRRLYDHGRLVRASHILDPLVLAPTVWLGPFDLGPRGLAEGMRVRVEADGAPDRYVEGIARLREGLSPGTVLVEESLAWSLAPRALTGGGLTAAVNLRPVLAEEGAGAATGAAPGAETGAGSHEALPAPTEG
jgi:anaerobic selenocysteine-containing dehydrogenase